MVCAAAVGALVYRHPHCLPLCSPYVPPPACCRFGGQSFYTCDRLTMCPLQKKMMDTTLMSQVRPSAGLGLPAAVGTAYALRCDLVPGAGSQLLMQVTAASCFLLIASGCGHSLACCPAEGE